MRYIQNPNMLLSLMGLSLLLISCYSTENQNITFEEELLPPVPSDYTINLPLILTHWEFTPPRVPGFVPPDYEASPHEVPVTLPACDGEALIIDDRTDLGQIDWNANDVYCLLAGDYTSLGELIIEDASGTASLPKVLRYYDPADDMPPHPVKRADSLGPEAVFRQFQLKNANYWILDGLTIRNSPEDNRVIDSSNNIFNRLLIEGGDGELLRIVRDSDDNVVQNSVLRNQSFVALRNDEVCLLLYTQDWDHIGLEIENTRIVNNEIYNCNDGVNLLKNSDERPAYYPGTIVANNDIYITDELYTDCLGNLDPDGACACAENAFDIKATVKKEDLGRAETWVRLINNRVWGYRHTDETEDSQGNPLCPSGSNGTAILSHYEARSLVIQGNIIMNSPKAIGAGGAEISNPSITSHLVVNNLIYNIHDCFEFDKQGMKQFHLMDQGRFLACVDGNDERTKDRGKGLVTAGEDDPLRFGNIHFGNTLINVGDEENESGYWIYIQDASHTFECNAALNSASKDYSWHETNMADKNAYYKTMPYCPMSAPCEGQYIIEEPTVEAANHASFTFARKRWTGPEQITIQDVQHTSNTPQFDEGGVCWIDDPSHPWN